MKTKRSHPLLVAIGILLAMLYGPLLSAQISLSKGMVRPAYRHEYEWYWNPITGHAWKTQNGEWKMARKEKCKQVVACHEFIFLELEDGRLIWCQLLTDPEKAPAIQSYECHDSIVIVQSAFVFSCYDTDGIPLSMVDKRENGTPQLDTLLGNAGYSLSKLYSPMLDGKIPIGELMKWGFLDTHGHWRIEAKFDAPFRFENGIAEVIYYGQKRRINEKGEFVESLDRRSE